MLDSEMMTPQNHPQSFYIFHLMGTHLGYDNRYPGKFAKFTPKDLENLDSKHQTLNLDKKQIQTKTNYLNAIYYNDFVVSSIIQRFADDESIIFYLSDHADEVYDDREFVGHSETICSRFMVEIPFMIYMSDSFKSKYPDIAQKVQNAQNLPFMSDDFIHSFLDLLGITTQDSLPDASIFSPTYNDKRARICGGKDYDKDLKNNANLVPSKLWLHRTDEVRKFQNFQDKYQGFEIDVHFIDTPTPYFDVGHDGKDSSIGLDLGHMFKIVRESLDKRTMNERGGGKLGFGLILRISIPPINSLL